MRRRKFTGCKYYCTDVHEDAVYRYVYENGIQTDIYEKIKGGEVLITHPESVNEALDATYYGFPITKEQYDKYDPTVGIIACGLLKNHQHGSHYNEEEYAKERAKGKRLGFIDPNDPD